ncbi:hypothetical protein KO494_15690 [Lacinutrix sp. C3R15]|uniref:hypothetical protein n=1 Tax=Flavobacteriaceae TaxID=49546 RepID=UPI001C090668|nr:MULTISPECIES: hypothetical protein [Flavobacteriaceae]MBU2940993.1 hypothetical protein [Lacinutrix sp. C3R15]MDO6624312.1 hypothetical protein [Oceanihabitans sp. 1_MG-2023]
MKKWYICTLIIAFALLGYISKEQTAMPNQKIVLQFSNTAISSIEIENTVAIVKKQLVDFGVDNIHVSKIENGQLKITYYSDADVVSVKNKLSKAGGLAIDYTSKNNKEYPKIPVSKDAYNLDVYKIQDAKHTNSGFDGKVALEPKIESDRYFNPNVYFFACLIQDAEVTAYAQVAYKVHANIAIAIDNTSYKIPEVRAGPYKNKTS